MPPPKQVSLSKFFPLQLTVSAVIANWKHLEIIVTQQYSGRPSKVAEQGHPVNSAYCWLNNCRVQTSPGINISTNSVRQELQGMGFHCQTASLGVMCRRLRNNPVSQKNV